jgi:hypothetical protein
LRTAAGRISLKLRRLLHVLGIGHETTGTSTRIERSRNASRKATGNIGRREWKAALRWLAGEALVHGEGHRNTRSKAHLGSKVSSQLLTTLFLSLVQCHHQRLATK